MKSMIITAALALIFTSALPAADWPQWRGPDRDGISQETGLMKQWPEGGPKVIWQKPLGEGYSAFSVADGRAITMSQDGENQIVIAFDADTGAELWRHAIGRHDDGGGYPGPRSTPTIDGERVYALDSHGNLACVTAETGKPLGTFNILEKFNAKNLGWRVSMSPLVDGNIIYVNPGKSDGSSIAALNKFTGEPIWTAFDDIAGYSSPIIATLAGKRQIVFFTGQRILGATLDKGQLLWDFPWKTAHDVHAATPIVDGDHVFFTSGYNVGCAVIEINGEPIQATEVWRNRAIRGHMATPVLHEGHLYGFDDNILTCVAFDTGETKWKQRGFGKGSLMMADGLLYVLALHGKLALVRPTPEKFEPISESRKLLGDRCWTMPVVANGKLYLRDEENIMCLDIAEQ